MDSTPSHPTIQHELRQWRTTLLNGLFIAFCILGAPLVLVASISVIQNQPAIAGIALVFFVACYLLILVFTFVRRIPYLVRVVLILAILYAVGIYDVSVYGLISDGRIYFVTIVILAALLIGVRMAIALLLLTSATMIGIGAAVHNWSPTPLFSTANVSCGLRYWSARLLRPSP